MFATEGRPSVREIGALFVNEALFGAGRRRNECHGEKSLVSPNVLRAQLYDRETRNVQFVWDSGHAEQAQGILLQL